MRFKGEEIGEGKENDCVKYLFSKERIVDFLQFVFLKLVMIILFFKFNLFVFDGDFCVWLNWYGMFKVLVDD